LFFQEDTLVISETDEKVRSIALDSLSTQQLVQEYGGQSALDRYSISYTDRTYSLLEARIAAAIGFALGPMLIFFAATLAYPSLLFLPVACIFSQPGMAILLGFIASGIPAYQYVDNSAHHEAYLKEDEQLALAMQTGINNLSKLSSLENENLDTTTIQQRLEALKLALAQITSPTAKLALHEWRRSN